MSRFLFLVLLLPFLATLAAAQCAWNAAGQTGCQPVGQPRPLPEALKESSGVAFSALRPGVLWSHNDGGHDPALHATDTEGRLLGTFLLRGIRNRDWEDIATGRCQAGGCIYLADTGDNEEVRPRVDLYRITDPGTVEGGGELAAERLPLLLPDGPRDIEAVFVLPDEQVYFVTKGRSHPVTVYRYPPPLRPEEEVSLEPVQTLSDGALPIPSQVTGADASPDGTLVVVRTYESLTFYRMDAGRLVAVEGGRVDLRTLQEPQGEAVGLGPDGQVVLTTEAGSFGGVAALRMLRCGVGGE